MHTQTQMMYAKGFVAAVLFKNHSDLTRAYAGLAVAAVYGIKAARDYNSKLDALLREIPA